MDVVADLPTDTQTTEPVQQRDRLFHYPAMNTQTGAVFDTASGKVGGDAFTTYLVAVDVVVVGPVGVQAVWSPAWTAAFAAYRRDGLDQREELSDVVSVAAGQGDGQRDARAFGDDMVFRAGLGTVDRARAGFGPPFKARTCEPSITALDQSNLSAALSSASSSSCRRCQTPAWCHWANRRQQVIPEPNPNSCGRNSHGIAVYSTNRMPHSTCRSGTRLRPGLRKRRGCWGNSGSIRSHSPSGTIHGGCSPFRTVAYCRSSSTVDERP